MLNSLQVCRALAAIMIVLCHANDSIFGLQKYYGQAPFGTVLDFAHAGVDLFFVLSGFIIMYAHTADIDRPRQIGAYLWKRYSRILPLYWTLLAAVLPVYFLVPQFGKGIERDPDVIFRSFFLLPHPQGHIVIVVAWTLVFESLFYLFFGVLVLNKKMGVAVICAWTVGCLASAWIDTFPWSFVCNSLHLRFVAGMVTCVIFQKCRIPAPRLLASAGGILFLTMGTVEVFYGLWNWAYIAGYTLSSVLIVAGCAQADRSGLTHAPHWLVYLGNGTYSIYLVHFTALSAIAKLCMALRVDQYVPLIPLYFLHVAGAIGVGCLCYHWLELPLYRWTKQFFRDAKPLVVAEPAPMPEIRKAA
jgi:exopolysaccharide production protein ExoZ